MLNLSMQAVRSQAATRTGTMPGSSTGTGPSAGSSAQLATQLQQLTTAIRSLADAMSGAQLTRSAPRTVAGGGGGGGAASSCGCSSTGSSGAPPAKEAATAPPKKKKGKAKSKAQAKSTPKQQPEDKPSPKQQGASGAPKDASSAPKKVHGEESHNNLSTRSKRVLDAAHDAGLKLVSGHRPGDSGGHGNGSAVDVGNVKLGTRQGSKEMAAFAEQMRQAGKRGDDNIGYVIYNQKIASARNNWAWRPMEDRGSNTQNHFDHVHVSTDPNR